jgi:hypothetical protein
MDLLVELKNSKIHQVETVLKKYSFENILTLIIRLDELYRNDITLISAKTYKIIVKYGMQNNEFKNYFTFKKR